MKKLFVITLAAALALSLAACTGGSETSSQTESSSPASAVESKTDESKAEESTDDSKTEDSKTETSDTVEEAATELEKALDNMMTVAGEKTKSFLNDLKGETLTVNVEITSETKGEQESSASALGDQTIGLRIIKNKDISSRMTVAVGMMSIDILKNEDGTYYLNSATKKAAKIDTDTSGADSSSIISSMTGMMGNMGSIDIETALDDVKNSDLTDILKYTDTTEMEYGGSTYTSENYTINGKNEDGTEVTSTMNILFDDSTVKYILLDSETAKMDVTFKEISTEIDDSQLVVPENYEITETSTVE